MNRLTCTTTEVKKELYGLKRGKEMNIGDKVKNYTGLKITYLSKGIGVYKQQDLRYIIKNDVTVEKFRVRSEYQRKQDEMMVA